MFAFQPFGIFQLNGGAESPCTEIDFGPGSPHDYYPVVGVYFELNMNTLNSGGFANSGSWFASDLPPGLSINATTGLISGTPTTSGYYSSTVTAGNDCTFTSAGSTQVTFDVTI